MRTYELPIPNNYQAVAGGFQMYKMPEKRRVYRRHHYDYSDECQEMWILMGTARGGYSALDTNRGLTPPRKGESDERKRAYDPKLQNEPTPSESTIRCAPRFCMHV